MTGTGGRSDRESSSGRARALARLARIAGSYRGARLARGVVLLVALLTLSLGRLAKLPCLESYRDGHGALALDWTGHRQYADLCYSDTVPLYTAERLDQPSTIPYATPLIAGADGQARYMEYPVLTGFFQWINAKIARRYAALARSGGLPSSIPVVVYFDVVALGLTAAWLISVWAAMNLAGARRTWDGLLVAASPLVLVHAFTNFDALAVALATTGMLAWSRRRPVLAGVLLGLGGATKLYPLFLLLALALLCWRAGRLRVAAKCAATAAGVFAAVNAPVALLYPTGWSEFFRLNAVRGADLDSLYNVISHATGWGGFDGGLPAGRVPAVLNTVGAGLLAVCCAGIAWIAMTAPRRPRLGQVCLLLMAAFLLTNKVWSPQYSLWLVPLAVLALPRWRALLAWMIMDALVWVPRMLFYLGPGNGGLPQGYFLGAVVIRDLAVLGLCGLVVRDIYRPARDVVRRLGVDDPCGGVLDGAEDRVLIGRRRVLAAQREGKPRRERNSPCARIRPPYRWSSARRQPR